MLSNTLARKDVLNGIKKAKIKANNLNLWQIIILISFILILISLNSPWFSLDYNNTSYGAFSKITWIIWYLSSFAILLNLFIIFSSLMKSKIRLFLNNFLEDSSVFIFSSLLLFILWINERISLWGLQVFSSEITFHSGIIFYLLWSFLFLLGAFMNKKLEKQTKQMFLTHNSNESSHNSSKKWKNTTKLPF